MYTMTGNNDKEFAQEELIKTISYSQEEILEWILRLYVPSGCFDVDPTYSKGNFYKSGAIPKPRYCFDIAPQSDEILKADCRELPIAYNSIDSMIVDLPFLATSGASLEKDEGNIINRRFSVCKNKSELTALYKDTLTEAFRILKPKGILVMKCQDKVSSGKQYMMHCDIYNMAKDIGFYAIDLFILLAKSCLVANWQRNQKHARKYHSYFWVFEKRVIGCKNLVRR